MPLIKKIDTHTLIRLVAFALLTLAFQAWHWGKLPIIGDEPHYLLTSVSIIKDLDLNLYDNYQNRDFTLFGLHDLHPQIPARDGFIPPEHGIGFPLLVALPLKYLGLEGLRLSLILISLFTVFLVSGILDGLGYPKKVGTLAGLVLATSSTWQLHASRVLPECAAGFIFMAVIFIKEMNRPFKEMGMIYFVLGMLISFFPILYLKYTPIGVMLFLYCVADREVRSSPFFYLGVFLIGVPSIYVWISTYGYNIAKGTGGGFHDFALSGAFDRYWKQWFDKNHGLLVAQPIYILTFWLIPRYLKPFGEKTKPLLFFGTVAALAYSLLYGLFLHGPSQSLPGRYLCAALPLLSVLIVVWAYNNEILKRAHGHAFTILIACGILLNAILIFYLPAPYNDYLPGNPYHDLFYSYWPRVQGGPTRDTFMLGYYFLGFVILTKATSHYYRKL